MRIKGKSFSYVRLSIISLLLVVFSAPVFQAAHASYQWDEGTKVTLSEQSARADGPALAYDPANNKMFMAYTSLDSCLCLHFLTSTDMISWSSDVSTGFHDTSCCGGTQAHMAYDSNNQRVYVAWQDLIFQGSDPTGALNFWEWYMYVSSSSDGVSWSGPVVVQFSSETNGFWEGLAIAYSSASNTLVVVATDASNNDYTFTSTDSGNTWTNPKQIYFNNSPLNWQLPGITYFNSAYYLTSQNPFCVLQSTDLSSWTNEQCLAGQATNEGPPPIASDSADGLYHITYKGTNSGNSIFDTWSVGGAGWSCCTQLSESTGGQTALAYDPVYQSLLVGWTGTDSNWFGGCGCHLNVMQYHYVNPCASGCGGGGGSVADGSLITMADGTRVPVQNLRVGDVMLGYNTSTGQYSTSTILSFKSVMTTNMMIIHTASGEPFRVDQNPHQTLWTKTPDGSIGWLPVTSMKPGDDLFTPNGWTHVTSIEFAPGGQHTMFDIIASMPYFADNYLDPIYKV